ncbi:hypothetical protein [Qipengyuania psychrotolerans]|uniref:C-type lysozyme inhibitor domain-containing protein n=1 Tax=Qipengyuania psychrotolerans TaxID=2867238 RepID=A0ABX8ZGL5_9SPHN|nr:hypothetical protein [Qipengyuania psychrotolerans]QZD88146.1 hypothetical protein K3166_05595 [Qipengyuania psychrotolerans]
MRKTVIFAAIWMGACSSEPAPAPEVAEQGGVSVECALGGTEKFSSECFLVEAEAGTDTKFVVRHPDGGFRLLALSESPTGFEAHDGAAVSLSERDGDWVVLTIEGDRYRWKEPLDE